LISVSSTSGLGSSLMSSVWSNLQSGSSTLLDSSASLFGADTGDSSAMDLGASLADAISTAYDNEVQGQINLAADAAAKRVGVALPGTSGGTASSASSGASGNGASSVTSKPVSGKVSSPYGSTYAAQDIDGALAALDGIVAGTQSAATPAQAASAYGSNYAAQDIDGFLGNLDRIAAKAVSTVA
jgi:hypothetical protein